MYAVSNVKLRHGVSYVPPLAAVTMAIVWGALIHAAFGQDISQNSVTKNASSERKTAAGRPKGAATPDLVCPGSAGTVGPGIFPLFSLLCDVDADCAVFGLTQRCCTDQAGKKRCVKALPRPKPEPLHQTALGLRRKCPGGGDGGALAELLSDVRECSTDSQCWPLRICCADRATAAPIPDAKSYCRAPTPELDSFPIPVFVREPLQNLVGYMQCTPPPPPILDLFPKPCRNTFDCFPNICCQESGGKRFCRPPKRSVLAVIAGFTQRVGSSIRDRLIANQKPSEGLE